MQKSRTRATQPILDETFAAGTFYRLVGYQEEGIRSLHFVGDGTIICSAITVEHSDAATNVDGSPLDPKDPACTTPGWGLGPSSAGGSGSATTVGASEGRLWMPDAAIGSLTIAASTTTTGGARVAYGNQAARFTRVKIVVGTGGRLKIYGAGGLL